MPPRRWRSPGGGTRSSSAATSSVPGSTTSFPSLFGGEYIFDDVTVDPWTFAPETYGMRITPLRAYAHMVPHYYIQNFGTAVSHPDTSEYAGFAQDTIRVTDHFGFTLGVRYDFQAFRTDNLVSNYYFRDSGRVPVDRNNVAPRVGFAYSIGERRPLVDPRRVRAVLHAHSLDVHLGRRDRERRPADEPDAEQRAPGRPAAVPGVSERRWCRAPTTATVCAPPPELLSHMTTEVSAFAHDFQIPVVQQTSLSVEKEIGTRTAVGVNYLYVHGMHLIRARDVNLPPPTPVTYPVYDAVGRQPARLLHRGFLRHLGARPASLSCPFPPCLGDVQRPTPQLGSVNVFESSATSIYHGLTVSLRRRMHHGFGMRLAYTWARAMDDGQDALVVGRPATVENSYLPHLEWGPSTTDQRHRFVAAWTAEPQPFHRDHPALRWLFNDWRFAGVVTIGSGRPLSARIVGDANADGNTYNDRLPGYQPQRVYRPGLCQHGFAGGARVPGARSLEAGVAGGELQPVEPREPAGGHLRRRISPTRRPVLSLGDVTAGGQQYPASFRQSQGFLSPTSAYAPRQVQFGVRVSF